jgi:hypothetical protein
MVVNLGRTDDRPGNFYLMGIDAWDNSWHCIDPQPAIIMIVQLFNKDGGILWKSNT